MVAGGDRELLQYAFVDPLITDPLPQETPITEIAQLAAALRGLLPIEYFYDAAVQVTVGPPSHPSERIIAIPYTLHDHRSEAFAYELSGPRETTCAVLMIPGSGHNQGTAILAGEGSQGATAASLATECDVYVQIKPNEDHRAIHDGTRKLGWNSLYADLLSRGGSYSATYLTEAIALMRYVGSKYAVTGVAGLSQGGAAALLVALQVAPHFAIVAAGFSVIEREVYWAGFDQVIIPGLFVRYPASRIAALIGQQRTLFSLHTAIKTRGPIGSRPKPRQTCQFLGATAGPRIECLIHEGAHKYPGGTLDFVKKQIREAS